jgi:hypothetical protein
MFQNDHPARTLQLQRNDELARLDAEARGEYHQRFRDRITTIVGEDWPEPRTTSDLVALAGRVQTLAGDARSAEAIAAAQGTPITSDHLTHLQALRERIHLDISNQQPSRYGDDQNRESFFAHNKTLQPLVEKWDEAMENRDARIADLAAFIPQEVARCQLVGPAYIDGAVADCFSENILASFRRRDYGVPTLQLACRLGVAGENPENLWSAHLHSGTREYAVRLLPGPAELTTEGVAEYHRAVVAPIESELQACYAGIYGSAPASRVKAAQQALQQLSQPLLEEWRLQQISGATPAFSSSCPYCLAGLRI